ncbi:MAG: hypothetical protein KBS68_04035 [Clostridiales bacterium]|nr:hypothetical protein [Candidatus Crickella merdequi]
MEKSFFRKNEILLSPEVSDQMLQNILDACDMEPNMVPLDELESYNNYRSDRLRIYKAMMIAIIVMFLMVPLLFVPPEIKAVTQTGSDKPSYGVETSSLLPVKTVTATIDGRNIPVYENQAGIYSIVPDKKGTLVITVTAINGQYVNKKISVTDVDNAAPTVDEYSLENNNLSLRISDKISGVDFDTIVIIREDGKESRPLSIDETTGTVVFSYTGGNVTLSVKDKAGNELRLLLTDDR